MLERLDLERRGMPLYFAYGSNLSGAQMRQRCPESRRVGVGRLVGYRLDFTFDSARWGGGAADVRSDEGAEVWGLVYELTGADVACLDGYEGGYDHHECVIEMAGATVAAFTYVVREPQAFIAPSPAYLDILVQAAAEHGFPESYRRMLAALEIQGGGGPPRQRPGASRWPVAGTDAPTSSSGS